MVLIYSLSSFCWMRAIYSYLSLSADHGVHGSAGLDLITAYLPESHQPVFVPFVGYKFLILTAASLRLYSLGVGSTTGQFAVSVAVQLLYLLY